jgi:hypothetical protein
MRCDSCNNPLEPHELFRTVELEDGTKKEILDNMCNPCLSAYTSGGGLARLDAHSHAFEYETEYFSNELITYSE